MDIQVDHTGSPDQAFVLQHTNRDGGVVEHAVTFTGGGEGVVRAACQVSGDAVNERRPGSCDCRSGAASRTLRHLGRPGESDPADFGRGEISSLNTLDVIAAVTEREFIVGGRRRHQQDVAVMSVTGCHMTSQPAILVHGKPMCRRQRQLEMVGIVKLHERDSGDEPMSDDPAKNPYTATSTGSSASGIATDGSTIGAFATTGTTISLGMIGGVLIISVVLSTLVLSDPPEDQSLFRFSGDDMLFLIVGYVIFLGGIAAAVVIRTIMKGQAIAQFNATDPELPHPLDNKSPLPGDARSLLAANQTSTIIGQALMEGPAVVNAIFLLLGDNFAHLIPIVLGIIGIAVQIPTAGKLKQLLEDARRQGR